MEHRSTTDQLSQPGSGGWESSKFLRELSGASDIETSPETGFRFQIGEATAAEKKNEDSYTYRPNGTAVVCDGVGSSEHGDEASHLVTDYVAEELDQLDWVNDRDIMKKAMAEILLSAHYLVIERQKATNQDMASTASAIKFVRDGDEVYAVIGNVGDSPIYRMRGDEFEELTSYHDDLEKAASRPALGKSVPFKPNVFSVLVNPGDRFVLSTNGVRKNDPELKRLPKIMRKNSDSQQAAEAIVTRLNTISPDARTVVIIST